MTIKSEVLTDLKTTKSGLQKDMKTEVQKAKGQVVSFFAAKKYQLPKPGEQAFSLFIITTEPQKFATTIKGKGIASATGTCEVIAHESGFRVFIKKASGDLAIAAVATTVREAIADSNIVGTSTDPRGEAKVETPHVPVHEEPAAHSEGYSAKLNLAIQSKGGLREKLLKGTEKLPANSVLHEVMQRFKSIGFKYQNASKSGEAVLNGAAAGDCRSLAQAMETIAHEIGFTKARVAGVKYDFMVGPGTIVDPAWGTGNANGGKNWIFQNHYWVALGGEVYDVLFTRRNVDLGKRRQGDAVDDPETGLTWEVYDGVRYYMGRADGEEFKWVPLSEEKLEKIKIAKKKEKSKPPEIKKPEPKKEATPPPEDALREKLEQTVHFLDVPRDLKAKTTKLLAEKFGKSGLKVDEFDDWAQTQIDMFMRPPEGKKATPFNVTFDEAGWNKWAS